MSRHADTVAPEIAAYLSKQERKELLRFLTCGSVDDGKSTLIGRLLYDSQLLYDDHLAAIRRDSARKGTVDGELDLSLVTDGLRAEREQGITIDVAYRYFSTEKRKFIIADTPGHEQYTRNMATGASTCDLAVILIDARSGVLPQTRRHSFIASLLGIRHLVVAINKMDLVGYAEDVFEGIKQDYGGFAARLDVQDIQFIPVSALKGDNVVHASEHMPWYAGTTLLHHLETVHIASDRNLIDFRFPVQYVNRPHLDFRGFCGTVASGIVREGDEVLALPSGVRSRVRSIVDWKGKCREAFAGQAVTLTLEDEIDVSRGDMLVHPGNLPRVESSAEAMLVWMGEESLVPGKPYLVKSSTMLVGGAIPTLRYRIDVDTLHRQDATTLRMNEIGRCTLQAVRPLCFDSYLRNRQTGAFIVIDRLSNRTVGAGMILDRDTSDTRLRDYWEGDTFEGAEARRVSTVTEAEREARYGQTPVTVLITGLSGAGKTTIARAVERRLFDLGRAVTVLDGLEMRTTISRDLGFSMRERSENLRRSIDVARILNDAGLVCLCAFMAPTASVREKAREAVGRDRFVEVYLKAPLSVCRARDQEGLYAKADAGEIAEFPGVSAPYEEPRQADLVLETDRLSVDQCVDQIVALLEGRKVWR